jgi:glycosyltransferase involved in cell wall biosynthesis
MARVTLAVPLYKRFDFLPETLACVQAQDYEDLDILISDNGENGPELKELLDRHLRRPYRLRRNATSVTMAEHFNQLWQEAEGTYFALVSDDDQIDANWISALVRAIEAEPDIAVALPRVDALTKAGEVRVRAVGVPVPPAVMTDREFVHLWCKERNPFLAFISNLSRVGEIREVGGYPELWKGNSIDNALLMKLLVGRKIAYVPDTTFRYRVYDESSGLNVAPEEFAWALRGFMDLMDRDEVLQAFAKRDPEGWSTMQAELVEMTWRAYRSRWRRMYKRRLPPLRWARAAFAMPFIPAYYRAVLRDLTRSGLSVGKRALMGRRPIWDRGPQARAVDS